MIAQYQRTIFGVPVQLSWHDLYILELALAGQKPQAIIELGTGTGASSLFFSNFGCPVDTFDIVDRREKRVLLAHQVNFHRGDIFGKAGEIIKKHIKFYRPVFLFCDDGDKPREFKEFAPHLKTGDIVAVHDYGAEITEKDIAPVVEECGLRRVYEKACIYYQSKVRVFEK